MPVYEYRCAECEKTFEKLIRSEGQAVGSCPSCGHERVNRVFSTFAVGAQGAPAPRCENPRPGCGRCAS